MKYEQKSLAFCKLHCKGQLVKLEKDYGSCRSRHFGNDCDHPEGYLVCFGILDKR